MSLPSVRRDEATRRRRLSWSGRAMKPIRRELADELRVLGGARAGVNWRRASLWAGRQLAKVQLRWGGGGSRRCWRWTRGAC